MVASVAASSRPSPDISTAPPAALVDDGAGAARRAHVRARAIDADDAFADRDPVLRWRGRDSFLQFRTDRRGPDGARVWRWVEAPSADMHGPLVSTAHAAKCASRLDPGREVVTPFGAIRVERDDDADHLRVTSHGGSARAASLPRGAFDGGCVEPSTGRAWLAWSTPSWPSSLFAVSLADGSVRPARLDARPTLGAFADVEGEALTLNVAPNASVPAASLVRRDTAPSTSVVLALGDDDRAPLARWLPLARSLAEAGFGVVRLGALPPGVRLASAVSAAAAATGRAALLVISRVDDMSEAAEAAPGVWLLRSFPLNPPEPPAGSVLVATAGAVEEVEKAMAKGWAKGSTLARVDSGDPHDGGAIAAAVAEAAVAMTTR